MISDYENFFGWQWDDFNEEIPYEYLSNIETPAKRSVHITHCTRLVRLPSLIWEMTNLASLKLSNTALASVPQELQNLTQLTYLSLSSNRLTVFPDAIRSLVNLETLNITDNLISIIPGDIIGCLTQLINLNLENNLIEELPTEIGNLIYLQNLSLTNNRLSSLPPTLINLGQLEKCYLDKNRFTWLPDYIFTHPTLEQLGCLNNNDLVISNHQVVALAKKVISGLDKRRPFLYWVPGIVAFHIVIETIRLERRDKLIQPRVHMSKLILNHLQKQEDSLLPDLIQEEILSVC